MRTLWAVLQLTRLDSSVLGFLSLFVPFYARTNDLALSIGRAIPLLFIWMCTFIANDLDDLERDQTNHPARPLPTGRLNSTFAGALYFICLALALFLTRRFVDQRIAFCYYALVCLSISYGYVVECLPSVKALYVAATMTVPLIIVALYYPDERRLNVVATAGFLFALGRELCMDIVDRAGDVVSWIHGIPAMPLAVVAFVAHAVGMTLLVGLAHGVRDSIAAVFMALVLLLSGLCWFSLKKQVAAYRLMKLQLLVGLYFLT